MGGAAEVVTAYLTEHYSDGMSLEQALGTAVAALGHSESEDRVIPADDLEVAVLDRTRTQQRKFSRLRPAVLEQMLGERSAPAAAAPGPEGGSAPAGGADGGDPPVAPPIS